MATAGSWRSHLFEPGASYKVLKEWALYGSSFKAGEIVKYESCGYERYDSASLFRFVPLDTSRGNQVWKLHDDEAELLANEYFERVVESNE